MAEAKIKTFVHLIMIPFTGVGLYGGFRGNDWYKYRIEIFKNYTLKSLLNQTNKRFVLWISFRPKEKDNLLTIELVKYLHKQPIEFIFTFNGLMYYDDKFTPGIYAKLWNYGRIIRGCFRNRNLEDFWPSVKELYQNKNKTLENRLENSLKAIQEKFGEVDWIYVTRIDSDDMLRRHAIEEIQKVPPVKGALIYTKGYIYNAQTKQLAQYLPNVNPPFHTIMFPRSIFFDAKKYLEYFGNFRSHEDVPKIFETKKLADYQYCVLVHNLRNQISTIFSHPFKGKEIDKISEKEGILKDFGIYDNS